MGNLKSIRLGQLFFRDEIIKFGLFKKWCIILSAITNFEGNKIFCSNFYTIKIQKSWFVANLSRNFFRFEVSES